MPLSSQNDLQGTASLSKCLKCTLEKYRKYRAENFLIFQESKLAPLLSTARASIEYFEKCQQEEMSRELQLFKIWCENTKYRISFPSRKANLNYTDCKEDISPPKQLFFKNIEMGLNLVITVGSSIKRVGIKHHFGRCTHQD